MTEFNPGGAVSLDQAVKLRYEANADTNAFTDAEAAKLAGIAAGANLYVHPTHTGDASGSGALTLQPAAITGKAEVAPVGADHILISDASDSGALKKALISALPAPSASGVTITTIGAPAVNQLQEIHDYTRVAGHLSGGAISDAGGGSVNVAAGGGLIRAAADDVSTLHSFEWAAPSALAIPANSLRYIKVQYNGGAPNVVLTATEDYDYQTSFPLGFAVNEGGTLYINSVPHSVGRATGRLLRRDYEVEGRSRASGLMIGNPSGLKVTVSAGVTWFRGLRDTFAGIDTSGAGTFDRYYRNGAGGWTRQSAQTDVDTQFWDDNTGTLNTVSNNAWASHWFYLGPSGLIAALYGRAEFNTLNQCIQNDLPPDSLPPRLQTGAMLLGRTIQQEDGVTIAVMQSAFAAQFTGTATTQHNDLGGLQGGTGGEYNHLTTAQHTALTTNFAASVAATAAVTANTAKVTNATHTGDVTGATALTIADNAVTNPRLADVPTATIKGRITAATGDPEDLTTEQLRTMINVANGATANATDAALRDRATHTGTQTAATISDLTEAAQDATGAAFNVTLVYDDAGNTMGRAALTGDVTAAAGSNATVIVADAVTTTKIINDAVTNPKLANMPANTIKGNNTGAGADAADLTVAQTSAMLLGGSTTQVQFNNGGVFGGAANTTIDASGNLQIAAFERFTAAAAPAAPAAGFGRMFAESVAGLEMPGWLASSGLAYPFEPRDGWGYKWSIEPQTATTLTFRGTSTTNVGTISHPATSAGSLINRTVRAINTSVATAGGSASLRTPAGTHWRGDSAGQGGFYIIARIGWATMLAAQQRGFIGLKEGAGAIGDVNPSTLLNIVGFAYDSGQTTLRVMHNDGTGTATAVDLGANFPLNTTDLYDVILHAVPNGSTIQYLVKRVNTAFTASGTISTDLPLNTGLYGWHNWVNNGTTASAAVLILVQVFGHTWIN